MSAGFARRVESGEGNRVLAALAAELTDWVLSPSLPRRDQRARGEQYLRGLLTVKGRKSMRNIATMIGNSAAEQSMHHFISASTWDWMTMREALALCLQRTAPPQAWVVQPFAIPKLGEWSVGVEPDADSGGPAAGQYAYGVWSTTEELSVPVNWRLYLSHRWLLDPERRRRAGIPADVVVETPEECAAASVLRGVRNWPTPRQPVVFDVAGADTRRLISRFDEAGLPLLARAGSLTALKVAAPSLPGYGAGPLPARQILQSVKGLRRPVEWTDPAGGHRRVSLAVAVPVTTPGSGRPDGRRPAPQGLQAPHEHPPLMLVGEWQDPARPPAHIWLTGMHRTPVHELVRLTKLGGRVAYDAEMVGERIGLRDFEGRSFGGWHRHMTLASVAHAVTVLSRKAGSAAPAPKSTLHRLGRRPVRHRCDAGGAAEAPAA
ncbi:IS701 family transposase [Streptomyces sp. NPDC002778]